MNNYTFDEINERVVASADSFIAQAEKAYSEKILSIVREVSEKKGRELIMLAGPSSSGKTTTARLLSEGFVKFNRKATVISLDDFYRDQDVSFTFEDGTVDYETVKALDTDCIYTCLNSLMKNGSARLPRFSFLTKRRESFEEVCAEKDEIIIVEGLHALNPLITEPLNSERMKKLYVSVSSRVYNNENDVYLTKRDLRFVRRLIRDFHHRNSDAQHTFYLWKGVRMGEDRYLFPFSNTADVKIDSFHPYEPCVFRNECIRLLDSIGEDSIYYDTAASLKKKMDKFTYLPSSVLPESSLLREFIG